MSMWAERQPEAADAPAVLQPTALTVSAYAARIVRAMRTVGGAEVEGEVQKPNLSRGGVLYFGLTDGEATVTCKVFGRDQRRLEHTPKDGDLVKVVVDRPDFFVKSGKLDLIVSQVQLAGEGELLRRREQLLKRLTDEGFTDPARHKPLPRFPRAVGVISGKDSKALTDVVQALRDRFPPARILTSAALVQGARAPADLIDALADMEQRPEVDVIVISRGGGSVQDLLAFDDERLCRAVFACRKPVVTAIGHTDDWPVCMHVSWSAGTPSRSAELVVPSATELRADLRRARDRLAAIPTTIELSQADIERAAGRIDVARQLETLVENTTRHGADIARAEATMFERRSVGLEAARTALRGVPQRLPEPGDIQRVAALVDARARGLFTRRRDALSGRARTLDDVAQTVVNLAAAVAAHAKRVQTGTHRQLRDHRHDYGRALARLLREAQAGISRVLERREDDVRRSGERASERTHRRLRDAARDLRQAAALTEAHDFRRRGWLLAEDERGNPVASTAQVKPGQRLRLHFRDGRATVVAQAIERTNEDIRAKESE